MNSEIDDSGNGATMPDNQDVIPQSARPLIIVLPYSNIQPVPPPLDNVETLSKREKLPTLKKNAILNQKRGPVKNQFSRTEEAYKQPISGPVLIPNCILHKKPDICKLARWQSSNPELANSSNKVELEAFKNPAAPVNKDTMKELEIGAIQNNTSLRIDLCFDDQLFFQPVKGRKGEEKQRQARVFWDCLALELEANAHALRDDCPSCAEEEKLGKGSDTRIPSRLAIFFTAQQDLVGMLVPDKDKDEILTNLDVEHLVRLSRVGHFDAAQFSTWLAQLLMTHCAPLRDELARQMNRQISDGAKTNDMDLLVKGLETLLSLLENMKLDVANHQVRSFKLLLIADTVPFLQDCFSKMRDEEQIDLKHSRKWFKDMRRKYSPQEKSDFDIFISGAVALCRSPPRMPPTTFAYDKDRIACLQNDVLYLTHLRICWSTFVELALAAKGRRPTDVEVAELSDRIMQVVSPDDGANDDIASHVDEIATEIARAINAMPAGVQRRAPKRTARESHVQRTMSKLGSRLRRETYSVMEEVIECLTKRTAHHASHFQKFDTLQIYNAQRVWSATRSLKTFLPAPDIEDIARRMAHIVVIHWSVWASLAYLEDEQSNSIPTRHRDLLPLDSTEQGAEASKNQACELAYHED